MRNIIPRIHRNCKLKTAICFLKKFSVCVSVLMHEFLFVLFAITVNLSFIIFNYYYKCMVCVRGECVEVYWLTSWCFCWRHACDVRRRNVLDTYIWRVMLMVHRINYPNSLCAGNSRRVAAAAAAVDGVVLKLSETITIVEYEQMNNSVSTKLWCYCCCCCFW